MFTKIKTTYDEFPQTFWIITLSTFIDCIGAYMVMPFISIYMIQEFNISMIEVGLLYTFTAIGNLLGGLLGGASTDKFGRKSMALYGLFVSGTFSLALIFIENIITMYIVLGAMGFFGSIGGPARSAMIADILTPSQRAEGYGVLRVVVNIAATIGPAFGGFLATKNFHYLFIGDAISSTIVAIVFIIKIPETKPKNSEGEQKQTFKKTMIGYKEVIIDWKFMMFVGFSMIMSAVYMQMNSTLPVHIVENLGFSSKSYGWMISMNAFTVVIMQFWITRKIKKFPALIMIGLGNLLYAFGFGMFGFIKTLPFFFVAMFIITIGEMVISPFSQAVAANLAPEDKRGRYMAVYGWSHLFPAIFGVLGAGLIMEQLNSNWLWYISGIASIIAVVGFCFLHKIAADRFKSSKTPNHTEEPSEERIALAPEIQN